MISNFNDFLSKLEELTKFYNELSKKDRNEATTRLHLIDTLFFECLGWDKINDCIVEERLDGKYSDYSFSSPHRLLIVEAKKEGTYFEMPAGTNKKVVKIKYFEKYHPKIYAAIKQALDYCLCRGTPFGCVCNGHQIIAFLGSRTDGVEPLKGTAVVFESLTDMTDNFRDLWNYLSKPVIVSHKLSFLLKKDDFIIPPPEKLSKNLMNYPGYKNRNDLQTNLQILGDLIIEDVAKVTDEVEFLRNCYFGSGALSKYALVSKKILQTRYSSLFEKTIGGPTLKPLVTKSGITQEAFAESISRRPVLFIGDVGVGKTIFIRHFINIAANEIFDNSILFYIDFGIGPTLFMDLRPYISANISEQLEKYYDIDINENKFVRGVYYGSLQKFKKGVYSYLYEQNIDEYRLKEIDFLSKKINNKEEHIKKILLHISKARKKQIIIFLDNVDQRPYEFQQDVFLIGQSMAEIWPATVFISIRPETFYKSKYKGTLSAYHAKAFTISPPRVDKVVQKRIEYAINLLKQGKIPSLQNIRIELDALKSYLMVLHYSFEYNKDIIEFIDNVCGGNVRLALDFVRVFIGSGHVNTGEILDIYNKTGKYLIALHHFLRAVIHGDNEYFEPNSSEILNIFDISTKDSKEHFLSLIILFQLDRWSQSASVENYTSQNSIFLYLQNLGFQFHQIDFALSRLLSKKLIESNTKLLEQVGDSSKYYRITSIGVYYYTRMVKMFSYIDAMTTDTPIISEFYREKIIDVDSINDRLLRVYEFLNYLDEQWQLIERQDLAFYWPNISKEIKNNMKYIESRIYR